MSKQKDWFLRELIEESTLKVLQYYQQLDQNRVSLRNQSFHLLRLTQSRFTTIKEFNNSVCYCLFNVVIKTA